MPRPETPRRAGPACSAVESGSYTITGTHVDGGTTVPQDVVIPVGKTVRQDIVILVP